MLHKKGALLEQKSLGDIETVPINSDNQKERVCEIQCIPFSSFGDTSCMQKLNHSVTPTPERERERERESKTAF
jgi:hypothetical protein